MSLYGLPEVTPAVFRWTPLVYAMVGPLTALLLWVFIGAQAAMALAAGTGVAGLLAGCYAKYRSRFALRHAWVMQWVLGVWLATLAAAAVLFAHWVAVGQPSPVTALVLLGLALAISAIAGFVIARRQLRGQDLLSPTSPLHRYVDSQRFVLRAEGRASAGAAADANRSTWAAALGVNLPLLAALAGIEGVGLIGLVAAALAVLVAWMLWAKVGPGLAVYGALLRLEKQQGRRFVSDQQSALTALRRQAWGARWFCRADEVAEPASAPPPARAVARSHHSNRARRDAQRR